MASSASILLKDDFLHRLSGNICCNTRSISSRSLFFGLYVGFFSLCFFFVGFGFGFFPSSLTVLCVLNMFYQTWYQLVWGAQLCPVVGPWWSQLESAVLSTGQPQPLLTETIPAASAGHLHTVQSKASNKAHSNNIWFLLPEIWALLFLSRKLCWHCSPSKSEKNWTSMTFMTVKL